MDIGDKFFGWTVLDASTAKRDNGYKIKCQCLCGNTKLISKKYLTQGKSRSCGCRGVYAGYKDGEYEVLRIESGSPRTAVFKCLSCSNVFSKRIEKNKPRNPCKCKVDRGEFCRKHGESPSHSKTREYNIWRSMRQRCNYPSHKSYSEYGGRGIKVCEKWSDYSNFIKDMGRCPPAYSLDRINPNGDYTPENCRWADKKTQAVNRRITIKLTFEGVTDYLPNWADKYGVSRSALYQRYRKYGDCGDYNLMLRERYRAKR